MDYAIGRSGARDVWIEGSGQGGVLAIAAALCCGKVSFVSTIGMPASLRQYFGKRDHVLDAGLIVPGLVKHADIPDLVRLAEITVEISNPVDPMGRIMDWRSALAIFDGAPNAALSWRG